MASEAPYQGSPEQPVVPVRPVADSGVGSRTGRRARLVLLVFAAIGIYQALTDWRDRHTLLINTSPSLPNWAFILDKKLPPGRGSLVFFDPPHTPLVVSHFGANPSAFGKRVYGIAGDRVTQSGRTFFVNGHQVAVAKLYSVRGEPLELGPTGIIPKGCYFVGSPHKDGFDSRYAAIGWICQPRIFGTGTAVL